MDSTGLKLDKAGTHVCTNNYEIKIKQFIIHAYHETLIQKCVYVFFILEQQWYNNNNIYSHRTIPTYVHKVNEGINM